jgi:hypothetical protein
VPRLHFFFVKKCRVIALFHFFRDLFTNCQRHLAASSNRRLWRQKRRKTKSHPPSIRHGRGCWVGASSKCGKRRMKLGGFPPFSVDLPRTIPGARKNKWRTWCGIIRAVFSSCWTDCSLFFSIFFQKKFLCVVAGDYRPNRRLRVRGLSFHSTSPTDWSTERSHDQWHIFRIKNQERGFHRLACSLSAVLCRLDLTTIRVEWHDWDDFRRLVCPIRRLVLLVVMFIVVHLVQFW